MQSNEPFLMVPELNISSDLIAMAGAGRLPCTSLERISTRDAKLLRRERTWAEDNNLFLVKCYCNICVGSPSSRRSPAMCAKHLLDFGRHPYYRGRTQVISGYISDDGSIQQFPCPKAIFIEFISMKHIY